MSTYVYTRDWRYATYKTKCQEQITYPHKMIARCNAHITKLF